MGKAIYVEHNGHKYLFEVDESVGVPKVPVLPGATATGLAAGMQPVADLGEIVRNFSEIKALIRTVSDGLIETIAVIPRVKKVSVEFGVKLGGEAGVPMITKATGEGSLKISLEWAP